MSSRGVLFAITPPQLKKLLAAPSDEERIDVVQEEIEDSWDEEHLCETDKAWDAIHRCLTDGTLTSSLGTPSSKAILGGKALLEGEEYYINLVARNEVGEVALALEEITQEQFRAKYFAIDPADYGHPPDEQDFQYTWDNFEDVRDFYAKASEAKRAVIFTVDQ